MSPRTLISLFFASSATLLSTSVWSAETRIDVVYAGGTKTCTVTSDDANGVTLIETGANAGHLTTTSSSANPFSGDCGSVVTPPGSAIVITGPSATGSFVINSPFNVSFSTTGSPDYCTGEGSSTNVTGWSSSAGVHICDGAACASVSKTVTPTAIGTATFVAKCYRTTAPLPPASPVTSLPLNVDVLDVPPTACQGVPTIFPARMNTSTVSYKRAGGDYTRNGDLRSYLDIVGTIPPATGNGTATFAPFPGNGNNNQITWQLTASNYVAMAFTVPATFPASAVFELQFVQTAFLPQNAIASMTLSECPGDFRTGSEIVSTCKAQWDGNDGGLIAMVADNSPEPASTTCRVTRGKTYYLNFVGGTLGAPATTTCASGSCSVGIVAKKLAARPAE
jgi:hypothetical protein